MNIVRAVNVTAISTVFESTRQTIYCTLDVNDTSQLLFPPGPHISRLPRVCSHPKSLKRANKEKNPCYLSRLKFRRRKVLASEVTMTMAVRRTRKYTRTRIHTNPPPRGYRGTRLQSICLVYRCDGSEAAWINYSTMKFMME